MSRIAYCLMSSMLLAACAGLPSSGPTAKQILEGPAKRTEASPYRVIDIDANVAGIVAASKPRGFSGSFTGLPQRSGRGIGVGDTVAITIFEASTGGLFGPEADGDKSGAPRLNLPVQVVDAKGSISVPYAGSIRAAGRSPQQVQKTIEQRLAKRAIEPQAIVTVVSNESRVVAVTGDVEKGGRFPLNSGSERVLDALALAGGARGAPHDAYVKLTRGGASEDMALQRLVNSPSDNITLAPGDQIFIYNRPQRFVALGASTENSEVDFGAERLSLAQAMARARGLDDRRADPAGVFVFRYEDGDAYARLTGGGGGGKRPIVYRLNLKKPSSLLVAQRFPVKDGDVVYFANSPSTELSKFLGIIGAGVGVANGGATTVIRVAD